MLAATGWAEHRPPPGGAARDRWQSLAALVDLAVDLVAESPTLDLAGFVAHLAERANAQHAPTVQGVTLASMHAAKGLEWDAVFVVGAGRRRRLPIAQSLSRPDAVEEERRLLYVGGHAGPRAADAVLVAGAQPRRQARPAAQPLPHRHWRRSPRRAPGRVARPKKPKVVLEGEAGELFERLRAWRSSAAQAASVPAYVVFTDATLQAIAETRPPNLRELAALPGIGARKLELYGAGRARDRRRVSHRGARRGPARSTSARVPEELAVNSFDPGSRSVIVSLHTRAAPLRSRPPWPGTTSERRGAPDDITMRP